jgi:hypothetical protein
LPECHSSRFSFRRPQCLSFDESYSGIGFAPCSAGILPMGACIKSPRSSAAINSFRALMARVAPFSSISTSLTSGSSPELHLHGIPAPHMQPSSSCHALSRMVFANPPDAETNGTVLIHTYKLFGGAQWRGFNHLVSHCREIAPFRQARNLGKRQNTVHCNHCTVRPGSGSAAQVARRQNPKRGLRRSCPDWE